MPNMTSNLKQTRLLWLVKERSIITRYTLAFAFSIVALLVNWVLHSETERNLFFLSTSAVTASASICGYGPGILATILTSEGLNIFFLGDSWSLHLESKEDLIRIMIFALTGGIMTLLGGTLRASLQATRKAQFEAEEAVRARDEFISIVSHELKTPLTSLKLQTQLRLRSLAKLVPEELLDRAKQEKALQATNQTLSRAERLIEDLLDFSRIAHGKMRIELELVEAGDILRSVIESLSPDISQRGVQIRTYIEEDIVGAWDSMRIEQVVLNLLSNALKYGEGAPIDLGVKKTGQKALIYVTDHGPGISVENQKTLFNRFERVSVSKSITGVGLGLYISKRIVELHHGRLWLESTLGKGTTLFVELPL